jgi:hypothetical protein
MEEGDNVIDAIKKRNADAVEQMISKLIFSKEELEMIIGLIEKKVIQDNCDPNCVAFIIWFCTQRRVFNTFF